MIGDYLIPTGPDYGQFRNGGPYGGIIHDLECPRNVNVRSMTGPGSYPANANVSPHIIAGMKENAQLLDERRAGAHVGSRGNMLFVGFEVTGYARWTKAEWMSDISNLLNQARAVAALWKRMGWKASDLRWGSLAELKEARRRFDAGQPPVAPRLWTHNDVSEALGGTNHWDPGLGFPFPEFIKWCLQYLDGTSTSPGGTPNLPDAPTEGGAETDLNDMADITDAQMDRIADKVVNKLLSGDARFAVGDQVATVTGALADLLKARLSPAQVWEHAIPPGFKAQDVLASVLPAEDVPGK